MVSCYFLCAYTQGNKLKKRPKQSVLIRCLPPEQWTNDHSSKRYTLIWWWWWRQLSNMSVQNLLGWDLVTVKAITHDSYNVCIYQTVHWPLVPYMEPVAHLFRFVTRLYGWSFIFCILYYVITYYLMSHAKGTFQIRWEYFSFFFFPAVTPLLFSSPPHRLLTPLLLYSSVSSLLILLSPHTQADTKPLARAAINYPTNTHIDLLLT